MLPYNKWIYKIDELYHSGRYDFKVFIKIIEEETNKPEKILIDKKQMA